MEQDEMEVMFGIVFVMLFNIVSSVSNNICGGNDGGIICCIGYKWENSSKACVPCAVGLTGNNCDTKCSFPSYGRDCQMACACRIEDCDFVSGCNRSLDGSFESGTVIDGDNTAKKKCKTTMAKRNKSDGIVHAIIALAVISLIIIIIYVYTHLLERHQHRSDSI